MRRVYIAGPMSGIEELNFPAFRRAAELVAEAGWTPVSPLDLELNQDAVDGGGTDRHIYLREDFRLLLDCDAILLMRGWSTSVGANAELAVARMIGLDVYDIHSDEVIRPFEGALPFTLKLFEAMRSPYMEGAVRV